MTGGSVGYLPGDHWLVSGPRALVVVGGGATGALRWWPRVRDGADAAAMVALLHEQGLLTGDVPVALVCPENDGATGGPGQLRVLVRGDLEVVVTTTGGDVVRVTGRDLLTWREQLVAGATTVHLVADPEQPDVDGPPDPDDLLPMPAGVVQAGVVSWQLPDPAAAAAPAPAPAAAPPPAPVAAPAAAHAAAGPEDDDPVTGDGATDGDGAGPGAGDDTLIGVVPGSHAHHRAPEDPLEATRTVPADDLDTLVDQAAGSAGQPGSSAERDGGDEPDSGAAGSVGAPAAPPVPHDTGVERTIGMAAGGFVPPPFPFPVPGGAVGAVGAGPVASRPVDRVPGVSGEIPLPPPPFVPTSTTLPPIDVVPGVPDRDAVPTGPQPADPTPLPAGPPDGAPHAGDPLRAGDHDGRTVLAESLPADHRPPPLPPEPAAGQVYAVRCPAGHPNPPHAGDCRVCGSPIPPAAPVLIDRPLLARLRMSTGAVIDLDRRVVVGRAPSVARVGAEDVPHLVTVPSPHQDVSRSHLEVRVEDWHVVVTDLNSTNGTEVHAPGRPAQVLRGGEAVVVEIGWRIDLGDGADLVVEGG